MGAVNQEKSLPGTFCLTHMVSRNASCRFCRSAAIVGLLFVLCCYSCFGNRGSVPPSKRLMRPVKGVSTPKMSENCCAQSYLACHCATNQGSGSAIIAKVRAPHAPIAAHRMILAPSPSWIQHDRASAANFALTGACSGKRRHRHEARRKRRTHKVREQGHRRERQGKSMKEESKEIKRPVALQPRPA